jgi:hypothetical protein
MPGKSQRALVSLSLCSREFSQFPLCLLFKTVNGLKRYFYGPRITEHLGTGHLVNSHVPKNQGEHSPSGANDAVLGQSCD